MSKKIKLLQKSFISMLVFVMTLGVFTTYIDAAFGGTGGGDIIEAEYTITKRFVDENGTSVKPSTEEIFKGAGKTWTSSVDTIANYVYLGYYIQETGNASSLATGNPTLTTNIHAYDTVNNKGAYTVVLVYTPDDNNNKVPDKNENYTINESFVDQATEAKIISDEVVQVNGAVKYTPNPATITNYEYVGYFYTAGKGMPGSGSLANPITGTPTEILLRSPDNDGVNTYNITYVYKAVASEKITITFNKGNTAATGNMPVLEAIKDSAVKLTPNLYVLNGYAFDGWATEPNGERVYNNEDVVTLSENTTLYARWLRVEAYWATITYDKNAPDAVGSMLPDSVVKNVSYQVKTVNFSRDGYTFIGWATSPTGAMVIPSNGSIIPTGNMTLYAVWQKTEGAWANIKFMPNGEDVVGSMPDQSALINRYSVLNKNTFTRPGFTFEGWAETPEGAVLHTDQDSKFILGETTLYAVWKEDVSQNITITYNKSAPTATGTMNVQQAKNGVSTVLTRNAFVLANYVFLGWTDVENGTTVKYTDGQVVTFTTNTQLYAVWGRPNDGGTEPVPDKVQASAGQMVHWELEFWNADVLNSTPLYNTVVKIQLSSTLVYTGNFKVYKNNVEVTLDYSYDFATGLFTLIVGDLNPGDSYRVEFDTVVINSINGTEYSVTYNGDGSVNRPANRVAPFAMARTAILPRFGGSFTGTIVK